MQGEKQRLGPPPAELTPDTGQQPRAARCTKGGSPVPPNSRKIVGKEPNPAFPLEPRLLTNSCRV